MRESVFEWVLKLVNKKKILGGKTVAVDSTKFEADAAMKSIVLRVTGEVWRSHVIGLMRAEGIVKENEESSYEGIRRFDKNRTGKKVSNQDWIGGTDPEANIAKMMDGTMHLAYKTELVVDLDSRMILGAEINPGDMHDRKSLEHSLHKAQIHLDAAGSKIQIRDVAADKGYHSTQALTELSEHTNYRSYIPETKSTEGRNWNKNTLKERKAVLANRRRAKRNKGRKLKRMRGEQVQRSFSHVLEAATVDYAEPRRSKISIS
jgi:hypothetical protein